MLRDLDSGKFKAVYIVCGYTDLRSGIDRLAAKIQEEFRLDPFDRETLFLFCGRRADRIKGLLWEGDGFLLLYKRLEDGRYKWPRNVSEVRAMSPQQYRWLMEGLNIRQRRYVKDVLPKKREYETNSQNGF